MVAVANLWRINLKAVNAYNSHDLNGLRNLPIDTAADFSTDYFLNITTPKAESTLVHFDPHFSGGFRNQVRARYSLSTSYLSSSSSQIWLIILYLYPLKSSIAAHEVCCIYKLCRETQYSSDTITVSSVGG
jgi:hypothetical protein